MATAPDSPKPKRHYTVTDKVREARRASLAKAREKARTALRGYERGPQEDDVAYEARLARQVKPWCANLRRAVAAKKADESAFYASHFTHGVTAPDLDRSAAAAGEDREKLRQHIERCQETIGGLAGCAPPTEEKRNSKNENRNSKNRERNSKSENRNSDTSTFDSQTSPSDSDESADGANRQSPFTNHQSDDRQSKLTLALAYVLWRALRLVRTQVRWERRALTFYLQELAGWRARNPALTPERLNRFRDDLDRVAGDARVAERRLARLRKRFEALWLALFDPEAWQRLAAHILNPSGVPNEPTHMAPGLGLLDALAAAAGGSGRRRRGRSGGARASRRGAEGGPSPDGQPPDLDADGNPASSGGSGPNPGRLPRLARLPRLPSKSRWDPLKWLCRTHSCGAQDWRLRLDRLNAATLSQPFQSPADVERALKRRAAAARVRKRRRRSDSAGADDGGEGERPRGSRSRSSRERFPGDGLLASLAGVGVLANMGSLSALRELLKQALGTGNSGEASGRAAAAPETRESSGELAELAEALWTRLEGFGVLADTLEEMLIRMLEYHCPGVGTGCSGDVLIAGPTISGTSAVRTPPLQPAPREAPTFDAILESRKARLSNPEPDGLPPLRNQRNLRTEDSAAGLRLEDLWIDTDLLLPNSTPLDGLRLWFEAAGGVLDAASHLAQTVDVAFYEFAVRRFGVRRDFVAWRPELSLNQWRERQGRPEWDVRVETVDGGVVVKLSDDEMIPE